jgi:hypothetical protein
MVFRVSINNLNFSEDEARELFVRTHKYWDIKIGRATSTLESYHIGVLMAGIRVLHILGNEPRQHNFDEQAALSALRGETFVTLLDICFQRPDELPIEVLKDRLDAVLSSNVFDRCFEPALDPIIQAGLCSPESGPFRVLLQDGTTIADASQLERRPHPKVSTS